jgi:DNA-binding transcriptional regulator LsrR (DeoR family)
LVQQKRASLTEEGLVALAEVAQLYYLEDYTQEQIAGRVGVSRSNVSRMLKEARTRGLVDIKVHSPLGTVSRLQDALKEELGLKKCVVLSTSDQTMRDSGSGEIASKVGAMAARSLQEVITDGSIVGVGWSSTVYHHVVSSGYLQEKKMSM